MPIIAHPYIEQRLESIYNVLMGSYRGGMLMSSAAKGAERELFVKAFLSQVFPPSYRFGTGDITDSFSNKSGQVDIVVEFPYLFSFPMYPEGPRLYLAEGVAAVIEVKSNIAKQWDEVLATAKKVKQLRRHFYKQYLINDAVISGNYARMRGDDTLLERSQVKLTEATKLPDPPSKQIPIFAVGYEGWKSFEAVEQALSPSEVDGVLILESKIFRSKNKTLISGTVWGIVSFMERLYNELLKTVSYAPTLNNYVMHPVLRQSPSK